MNFWYQDFYAYDPSQAAAVLFIVAFGLLLLAKIADYIRFQRNIATSFPYDSDTLHNDEQVLTNARKQVSVNLIPICIGLIFEILGYSLRIVSIQNSGSATLYIVPTTLIQLAPSFIATGVFMTFNTIDSLFHGRKFSIIPSGFLTVFLVTGDMACYLLQGLGGSMMLRDGTEQVGVALALVGLGIRLVFYAFCTFVVIKWFQRMNGNPTEVALLMDMNESEYQWRRFPLFLVASMVFIVIRCILVMSEFAEDMIGEKHFAKSEVAYYMTDGVLIFCSCLVFVISRPEYRLWEMKAYQEWTDKETKGDKDIRDDVANGTVVWRRTSWMYN